MQKKRLNLKEKQVKKDNLISMILIMAIFVCVGIITNLRISEIRAKNSIYEKRKQEIIKLLEEEKERKEYLENKKIHIKTDEYKIEVAKEKLGLVFPDEIIIKPE